MKFAAIIEYMQDKAKIAEIRPAHRQYLTALKERGQLAVCGPFTDDWGGLIVYEAASKEEANTGRGAIVCRSVTRRREGRAGRRWQPDRPTACEPNHW